MSGSSKDWSFSWEFYTRKAQKMHLLFVYKITEWHINPCVFFNINLCIQPTKKIFGAFYIKSVTDIWVSKSLGLNQISQYVPYLSVCAISISMCHIYQYVPYLSVCALSFSLTRSFGLHQSFNLPLTSFSCIATKGNVCNTLCHMQLSVIRRLDFYKQSMRNPFIIGKNI